MFIYNIEYIPNDIIWYIISYLDNYNIIKLSKINRIWYNTLEYYYFILSSKYINLDILNNNSNNKYKGNFYIYNNNDIYINKKYEINDTFKNIEKYRYPPLLILNNNINKNKNDINKNDNKKYIRRDTYCDVHEIKLKYKCIPIKYDYINNKIYINSWCLFYKIYIDNFRIIPHYKSLIDNIKIDNYKKKYKNNNYINETLKIYNNGKSLYVNFSDYTKWSSYYIGIPLYQQPGITYEWEIYVKNVDKTNYNYWKMVFGIEDGEIDIKNNNISVNSSGSGIIFNINEKIQNSMCSHKYRNYDPPGCPISDILNSNGQDNDKIKIKLSFPSNFPKSCGKLSFYKNDIHLGLAYDNIFSKNGYFFPSISCIGCNEISVKLINIFIQ
jgi:hypothetical protein